MSVVISTLCFQVFHNLLLHDAEQFRESAKRAVGDSLFELVDCAKELDDDRYKPFIAVGKAVLQYWQK